jgi:hypothetical protein
MIILGALVGFVIHGAANFIKMLKIFGITLVLMLIFGFPMGPGIMLVFAWWLIKTLLDVVSAIDATPVE